MLDVAARMMLMVLTLLLIGIFIAFSAATLDERRLAGKPRIALPITLAGIGATVLLIARNLDDRRMWFFLLTGCSLIAASIIIICVDRTSRQKR